MQTLILNPTYNPKVNIYIKKTIILHTFGIQVNPCKQGAVDQGPQYLVCNVACEGHIAKHLGPTKGFGFRGLGLGLKGLRGLGFT